MGLSECVCDWESVFLFVFCVSKCVVKRGNWISDGFSVAIFLPLLLRRGRLAR